MEHSRPALVTLSASVSGAAHPGLFLWMASHDTCSFRPVFPHEPGFEAHLHLGASEPQSFLRRNDPPLLVHCLLYPFINSLGLCFHFLAFIVICFARVCAVSAWACFRLS